MCNVRASPCFAPGLLTLASFTFSFSQQHHLLHLSSVAKTESKHVINNTLWTTTYIMFSFLLFSSLLQNTETYCVPGTAWFGGTPTTRRRKQSEGTRQETWNWRFGKEGKESRESRRESTVRIFIYPSLSFLIFVNAVLRGWVRTPALLVAIAICTGYSRLKRCRPKVLQMILRAHS